MYISYRCNYAPSCMSPTLNGSSEILHFKCNDAIEVHDGIMFIFYPRTATCSIYKRSTLPVEGSERSKSVD